MFDQRVGDSHVTLLSHEVQRSQAVLKDIRHESHVSGRPDTSFGHTADSPRTLFPRFTLACLEMSRATMSGLPS